MRSPVTNRRICPCRNVLPVFIGSRKYESLCIFIQSQVRDCQINFGRKREDPGYPCRIRTMRQTRTGFSLISIVSYSNSPLEPHGSTLPNSGLQERLAAGPRRATNLRVAFHLVAGGGMRGDAPRNGAREYSSRPTEGNHALYHRKWGDSGACGHQRPAPDG